MINKNSKKLIAVIGSRTLPRSYQKQVSKVVRDLLSRGYAIGSGGARGADLFALKALVLSGACAGSKIFLPCQKIEQTPRECRYWLKRFKDQGGMIIFGPASHRANRSEFVHALFLRSRKLVDHSSGIIAFIKGQSRGSWFTISYAISKGIPVIVFPVNGSSELKNIGSGRWVSLKCWIGAFRWIPENGKGGEKHD